MKTQSRPFTVEIRRKGRQTGPSKPQGISWDLSVFKEDLAPQPLATLAIEPPHRQEQPTTMLRTIEPEAEDPEEHASPTNVSLAILEPPAKRPRVFKKKQIAERSIVEAMADSVADEAGASAEMIARIRRVSEWPRSKPKARRHVTSSARDRP